MKHREKFNLKILEERIRLAKLLLDKAVDFLTEEVVLEFVD